MIIVKLAKSIALSEKHLTGHQAVSRRANELVQTNLRELEIDEIAEGFMSAMPNKNLILHFACECLNDDCHEKVEIEFTRYHSIHEDRNQFVVFPGHQTVESEGLVAEKMKYNVTNNSWRLT